MRKSLVIYRYLGCEDSEEKESNHDADFHSADSGIGRDRTWCHDKYN